MDPGDPRDPCAQEVWGSWGIQGAQRVQGSGGFKVLEAPVVILYHKRSIEFFS